MSGRHVIIVKNKDLGNFSQKTSSDWHRGGLRGGHFHAGTPYKHPSKEKKAIADSNTMVAIKCS